MVIHNENDLPVEMAVIKKPLFEQQSFNFHNNHVPEIVDRCKSSENTERLMDSEDNTVKKIKKSKKRSIRNSSGNSEHTSTDIGISSEDLEELKTVYKKCKEVINKIENKYGHLLDLDEDVPNNKRIKQSDEDICQCSLNKKIVYDDEGKESTVQTAPGVHICPKKLKNQPKPVEISNHIENTSVTVEYEKQDIILPENLIDLSKILKNPNIELNYRNQLVNKACRLKQEYINEIKFNKHSLVEKLKSNPDDLLRFKGTNLSTLSGYA